MVTTPQTAAADVAERAGALATQTGQSVAGVVENMSYLEMPDGGRMELFGSGGGAVLSERLSATVGTRCRFWARSRWISCCVKAG
ncbi:protein mrp homolog, partial [Arthrobacter sp. Hiyo6]